MSMTAVRLYGPLGHRFGREHHYDVSSPAEAVRALCATLPGFKAWMLEKTVLGYKILTGADAQSLETLDHPHGHQVIKIVPVVVGAEKSPLASVILGAAMIAATGGFGGALMISGMSAGFSGAMAGMGWAMVIGGVASVFSDPPNNPGITGDGASKPNTFFDGAVNTISQGNPVPVGYGRMRIGSAVISTGSSPESYPTGSGGGAFSASDGAGTMVGNGDTSPWIWSIDPAV
jgi:predicted phage tail protein